MDYSNPTPGPSSASRKRENSSSNQNTDVSRDNHTDLVMIQGNFGTNQEPITAIGFNYGFIAAGTSKGLVQLYKCDKRLPIMSRRLFCPSLGQNPEIRKIEGIGLRFVFISDDTAVATQYNNLDKRQTLQGYGSIVSCLNVKEDYLLYKDGSVKHLFDPHSEKYVNKKLELMRFNTEGYRVDFAFVIPYDSEENLYLHRLLTISGNQVRIYKISFKLRIKNEFNKIDQFSLLANTPLTSPTELLADYYSNKIYYHFKDLKQTNKVSEIFARHIKERPYTNTKSKTVILVEQGITEIQVKNSKVIVMTSGQEILIFDTLNYQLIAGFRHIRKVLAYQIVNEVLYTGYENGQLYSKVIQQ